jgi:putative ABC transport system permease protein
VYVLPLALGLAFIAGVVPAWRAASGGPLEAVLPTVAPRARARPVQRIVQMAFVNLLRLPARALVGGMGLAIGTGALTVLVSIQAAFQGTLVGTVLGNALSVQVRGADFLAIGLTIALAALSIADVLYLNLRERSAELVTLRTIGWSERELLVLVEAEALLLALAASALGAALGAVICGVLGVPVLPLFAAAAIATAGGVLVAALAALLPLSQLRRLTPPSVLAAE